MDLIKRSFKLVISFLLAFSIIIAFPRNTKAEESLTIPRWLIEAELLKNGDLKIVEDITFRFNDEYNGVFRELVLDKTDGLDNIKVSELDQGREVAYLQVDEAEKGDKQVFMVKDEGDRLVLQIFSPSEDEEKTFRIGYTVKNVAVKYMDTGELYYKFLGDENETPIGFLGINIKLPQNINDQVKIFAHGPTNGTINFSGNNMVRAEVEGVPTDTFVEVRVLFPADFIPMSSKLVDKNAYDEIIEEELSYIQEIKDREIRREKRKVLFNNISKTLSGVLIVSLVMVIRKLRRNLDFYEGSMDSPYPDDTSPAEVSYLLNSTVSTPALMATIFDLARKGYISIEAEDTKRINNFKLVRLKKDESELLEHERFLINWLFDKMGDGKAVESRDIKRYSKDQVMDFYKDHTNWVKAIKEEARKRGYYDEASRPFGILLLILSIIGFVIAITSLAHESMFGLLLLLTALPSFIYSITIFGRKSDYGYVQIKRWRIFMRDLRKMSSSLNIGDLFLSLDKALIYGLALGIGFDKLKRFKPLVKDSYMPNYWMYWMFLSNSNGENVFEKNFNQSFTSTGSSIGSGGGFSAGGGGGAGGGGAGGF
ncbi:MAG: DUF2207 domain-containing protein [Tissierellia bacterium]|nr:DUF2207 domain-containing protein [Tissierellia bacterium]